MKYADTRYPTLRYPADVDDACLDAVAACVSKLRADPDARAAFCRPFRVQHGVVAAFCDVWQVAPLWMMPRGMAVVFTASEWALITEALEQFR